MTTATEFRNLMKPCKCGEQLEYWRQFCLHCGAMQPHKTVAAFKACEKILGALDNIEQDDLPIIGTMASAIAERMVDSIFIGSIRLVQAYRAGEIPDEEAVE